jgi:hypothetical protein
MSLLFYDFNGSNQRLLSKKQRQSHPHHTNLADSIIPEEAGEDQGKKEDDFILQEEEEDDHL